MPPPIAKMDIKLNRLGISCGGCDEEGDFGAYLGGGVFCRRHGYRSRSPARSRRPTTPIRRRWATTGCGAYAGVNAGYEWGNVSNSATEPNGFLGGLQAGYNWQSGQFVLGAETDIQATGADDTFAPYKFSNPWFGTFRGRAGWARQ